MEEGGLKERESEFLKLLGGAGIELGGREPGGEGGGRASKVQRLL